ncbi:hypothetical protein [Pseudomonas sp. 273]|uniref:hypothetical protein n=1 Tax=Pseudomonas sp. 273 TaxID=75692 RepID=UPI0023D876DA|nr:hypothetical protein [Pseudomonas sp. 273]
MLLAANRDITLEVAANTQKLDGKNKVSAPQTPPSFELSACGCWAPIFPVKLRHDAS